MPNKKTLKTIAIIIVIIIAIAVAFEKWIWFRTTINNMRRT